ncbi:hypothetical protein ACFVXP_08050, partial [Streptomyces sp. NPDC058255]
MAARPPRAQRAPSPSGPPPRRRGAPRPPAADWAPDDHPARPRALDWVHGTARPPLVAYLYDG